MSLNKVMLIGNVGRDPEVRYLEGNAKVATFTLATTERFKDRSGELRENTEWHNIVCWRQNADVAERYVHKGTQLYIEGRLRTRSYIDQAGVKKYTTEIEAQTFQLLGRRPEGEGAPAPAPAQGGYQQPAQGGYQQRPAQPSYQAPAQSAYQAPAQSAYQAPVQTAAPAPMPVDDMPADDLPF